MRWFTDLGHQHTYLSYEGSSIYYEINGELEISVEQFENEDPLTPDQIRDWTIQYILWRK